MMIKTIYSRVELLQLIGEEVVEELEADGLEYQLAGGRYVVDIRDLPEDLGLCDDVEEDDLEEEEDLDEEEADQEECE